MITEKRKMIPNHLPGVKEKKRKKTDREKMYTSKIIEAPRAERERMKYTHEGLIW